MFAEHSALWVYDIWMLANGTGKALVKIRWRQLVLPDRVLCFRIRARTRYRCSGRCQRLQGGRRRQATSQQRRLLLVPAAGAKLQGEDPNPPELLRHATSGSTRRLRAHAGHAASAAKRNLLASESKSPHLDAARSFCMEVERGGYLPPERRGLKWIRRFCSV